ncbi:6,7-dimethyl-8-ribityllumazine synthase [Suicoccus acidiformans]|uniref:6,7-dimethyl-8-ribityllumazine synthase n=1 Tax=Suicoccus acidiformans TaxID=2036206 RepID=A0A347WI46_9LACT|nr:6,7-dimethyl-8-ribityllumazine synthase [Suicoccus acidiformans]AXY24753.1 6,7-dimethyl-8-ribityllumazine synthase [Suicoccus acidiformans]
MNIIEGNLVALEGVRIGIAIARFNDFLTRSLLKGAEDGLTRSGVPSDHIDVVWVPGAYELPILTQKMVESGQYDAVITLGAVIRGATSHYDVVVNQATSGISRVALDAGIPVILGILTVENIEQAIERAGTKAGNNGFTYATNAIEMINVLREVTK